MNETSFAHILFATGVPGKLFDELRAVRPVERPRPVGGQVPIAFFSVIPH